MYPVLEIQLQVVPIVQGFTQYVFKTSIGVQLGDWTGAQIGQGKQVPDIGRAQPGDLIFYENPNHVSIYLGESEK